MDNYPTCNMFVKIFPDDAVKDDPEDDDFLTKKIRYNKINGQDTPVFENNKEKSDWKWLNEFLDLANAACGNYGEHSMQSEQPSDDKSISELIEFKSLIVELVASVKNLEGTNAPAVKAIEEQMARLEKYLQQPIAVRDNEIYGNVLRALIDSKHPNEKYRRWVMWKNGKGPTEIATFEKPELAAQARGGNKQAKKKLESIADNIRKQIERLEKSMSDKEPDKTL